MEVEDDEGFGETDDFDGDNPWNDWKKPGNYNIDLTSLPGSGTALLEVSNRGGKASLRYFNAASPGDVSEEAALGDGFLMRRGLTVIWVGWQFDIPEDPSRLRLHVPVIPGVEGWVRSDWTVDKDRESLELGHRGHAPYDVVDPGGDAHVLTERDGRLAPRRVVLREQWRFVRGGEAIQREGGFPAGRIYELVYRATDPAVVGLGLAAIRDTMAFARHDKLCPFAVQRGFALGISQTGRFLRQFLYQGFNTDERRRKVFEGLLVNTAGAGRGSFNHRFGQPSRDAHRYSAFFYPTDLFPFSGRTQRDPLGGRRDRRKHGPDRHTRDRRRRLEGRRGRRGAGCRRAPRRRRSGRRRIHRGEGPGLSLPSAAPSGSARS